MRASIGLMALLITSLTACSHGPVPVAKPSVTIRQVDPEIWRLVDRQIVTASGRARHAAEAYARVAMEEWQGLVRQRTEEVFIPWYLNYWTQQWIGARVAWYELQDSEGEPPAEDRLIAYLQGQYYEQVLEPVASFVDPRQVMEETLSDYLRSLRAGIEWLPLEYGIPLAAFNHHLDAITAIDFHTVPPKQVSLYKVLQSPGLGQPAYRALLGNADTMSDITGQTPSTDRLQTVARRAVAVMADSMALRGGALAASGLLGGPLGVAISAGATVWGVAEHDRERPALEAQLRAELDAAFNAIWQQLVEDTDAGVMGPMLHLSAHIERAAARETRGKAVPRELPKDSGSGRGPAVLF